MHLIRLKDHYFLLLQLHNHGHMIEVAISQYSLEFSSQILSIEQKYISSFRFLQKLPLSKHILLVIYKFIHSLQHYFIFLAMEVKHVLDHILPFIY